MQQLTIQVCNICEAGVLTNYTLEILHRPPLNFSEDRDQSKHIPSYLGRPHPAEVLDHKV